MRLRLGQVLDNESGEGDRDEPMDVVVMRFWSRTPSRVAPDLDVTKGKPSIVKAAPRAASVVDLANWARARGKRF
jgi:hypothetical protein